MSFRNKRIALFHCLGTAYGIYTFFALVSVLFVVKVIVETKGKTLEQME